MNQTQSYMDVHSSHLSSAQPYASHASSSSALPNYHQYHQQPPVLQPASAAYGPASSYSQYGYPSSVTSPQSAAQPATSSVSSQMPSQLLSLPRKLGTAPLLSCYANPVQPSLASRSAPLPTGMTVFTMPPVSSPRPAPNHESRLLSGRMKGVSAIRSRPGVCVLPGERVCFIASHVNLP